MRRQRCPYLTAVTIALLAVVAVAMIAGGCKSQPQAVHLELIPANGFMQAWSANLNLKDDELDRLILRDGAVFAQTAGNAAYALSPFSGGLLAIMHVDKPGAAVRPPVVTKDRWIFPTLSSFEAFDTTGRLRESVKLDHAMRGPASGFNNLLFVGLDYPGGGRLAKIDIARAYGKTVWELLTFGGVTSAPAVMEDAVYCATDDGRVYAVTQDRAPIWSIQDGIFKADAGIVADLKADDSGVYVASLDSKLYCLDRATGRIKWTYYAGAPLTDSPIVTATTIYQAVPNKGLVAIDKLSGKDYREPLWIAYGMRMFLSADDVNVYALSRDNTIVALDKTDGSPKFKSTRRDFDLFTQNVKDSTIYAATKEGEVVAIKPVLKPGTTGQIVMAIP